MNEKHESFFESMRQKRSTPAGRLTFVGLRSAEYVFQPYFLRFPPPIRLSWLLTFSLRIVHVSEVLI
jgi:hypothetical protein